jgi:hypothetical protein
MGTYTYTTEAAAWQAVADVLQSGEMPVFATHDTCMGLCSIVARLQEEGHVSQDTRWDMLERIKAELYKHGLVRFDHWREVGCRYDVARQFEREAA